MLDDRKAAILRAVVEEYIETAQPVGSQHVARSRGVQASSATVRNEMSVLERDGYLVQPHTSAGRIPTDKGYRFFVDSLHGWGAGQLNPTQRAEVKTFFTNAHGELEHMLSETSQLLSRLTDHTAVVIAPPHEAATIRSVQVVGLGGRTALVVAVLSNGSVEKRTLELPVRDDGTPVGDAVVAAASTRLAGHLTGRTVSQLGEVPSTGEVTVDALLASSMRALTGGHDEEGGAVFVGGASRMANAFDAVATVRQVLGILEEQFVVVTLLRDLLDRGLTVAIGADEHGLTPLAGCSVLGAPVRGADGQTGTIGILGPTRMNYPQALAAVAVVSQRLGRRIEEG
ncbi:MAG TPA: heat-inducible transcriptional repressor HrcA [Acidimicrobiales bacterium]|nr:heat-inducible transcriptional repressor HrcA [Acidimicrobiales bacterium]